MVPKIPGAAVQGATEVAKSPKVESFGKVMQAQKAAPTQHAQLHRAQPPKLEKLEQPKPTQPVEKKPQAAALLNEVQAAQAKLDKILEMAESGRTFSPAELIAFQAHAYRASQELDLAGKVVDKATSGVKQTLQTQV